MENQSSVTSVQQIQDILLKSIQKAIDLYQNKNREDENLTERQVLSSNSIDDKSEFLTDSEKILINNLCKVVHFSRRENPIDLNRKHDFAIENQSKDKLKVLLANFLAAPIKRVVTFAQNLPDFVQLDIEDRICLLKEATIGISISASSSLYDSKSNVFKNMISREKNVYADKSHMDLGIMKNIWSEELFGKTISFLKTINELCIDEACLAIFLTIILFDDKTKDLKNKENVRNISVKYSYLLKKYMTWKIGDSGEKYHSKLLSKIPELKALVQSHEAFIQDVDTKKIDAVLLAFVISKKESKSNLFTDEKPKDCIKYEL